MTLKSEKKKILIAISNYLPGYKMGGPVASVANMIDALGKKYSFEVVTLNNDLGDETPYPNIEVGKWLEKEKYKIIYYKNDWTLVINLLKIIRKSDAEVVYLNSLFDFKFSICLVAFKKIGLLPKKKVILAPRGELVKGCLKINRRLKVFFLTIANTTGLYKNVFWHSTNQEEVDDIVSNLRVSRDSVKTAHNITTVTPIENQKVTEITNELKLCFISRISREKNLTYALDVLRHVKSAVIFDIYGVLENKVFWQECEDKIALLPNNVHVAYKGSLKREEVRTTFAKYDLFFFPSVGENYAHVIAESLSVGTPVLISDSTPWRQLSEKKLGWDISLDDFDSFVKTIEYMASLEKNVKESKRANVVKEAHRILKDSSIVQQYESMFS